MAESIADILYPHRCPICDNVLPVGTKTSLCPKCIKSVQRVTEPYCMKCGKPLENDLMQYCEVCNKHKYSYLQGRAAFIYEKNMRKSVAAFKQGRRKEYGSFYADEIVKKYGDWIVATKAQALIPVPIHRERYRKRGYNQAEVIAKYIGEKLNIPVLTDYLVRVKNTKALKNLNSTQRKEHLKKAFFVSDEAKMLYRDLRCVILVDDIYTTGSTIDECAKTLIGSGNLKIYFICACIGKGQGGE